MSDDIELDVKTLEPAEDEELSEEEQSCEQRAPMRKPTTLVQYWVDTGNTPYNVSLNKKELSEFGSSLSEEDGTSPSHSLLSNKVNESSKHKHANKTSSSSVDTAAYILSNANVTKKADIIAIIEGGKLNGIKLSENDCTKDETTVCNDRTKYIGTVATDHEIHNGNNNDVLHDTLYSVSMKHVTSDDQVGISTVIPTNGEEPKLSSQGSLSDTIDKTVMSSASQKSLDMCNIDNIVSIFQQFNKTSKRLSVDDKNNVAVGKNRLLKEHDCNKKEASANMAKEIKRDTSLVPYNRKKLYTGRNSPVDLILIERHSTNLQQSNPSNTKLNSHPALDPDNFSMKKSLVHKVKNKYPSFFNKKNSDCKKVQDSKERRRRKHFSVSNENIISDEMNTTNDHSILDSIVNSSLESLQVSSNNVDKRDDNLIRNYNDTNVLMKNTIQKYNLASCNLNPIVLLQPIMSLEGYKAKSVKNKDITQENRTYNNSVALKLYNCKVENLDLLSMDSEQSTIFMCECNNISQDSSTGSSFCLKLSSEEYSSSIMNIEKKDNKVTSLKNADVNQNKKAVVILKQLPESVIKSYTTTKKALNMNNDLPIDSEKLLDKPEIDSSNSHRTNIKNEVKLREIKVLLERLPADTYLKKSNNATNISLSTDEDKISQNTSTSNKRMNNKRKHKNTNKSVDAEHKKTFVRTIHKISNTYSLRLRTTFKENDDEKDNASEDAAKHDNQIAAKTKSNFMFRDKNHDGQVSPDKRKKSSLLDFMSSDEDDLVQLIQKNSKKRLKTLIDDKTSKKHIAEKNLHDESKLVGTNKNKYDSNKNVRVIIYSSKQDSLRKIDELIREKNRRSNSVERKSSSDVTSTDSFQMSKHKKCFQRISDNNDGTMNNFNGPQETSLFSDSKDISNNSERHSNKAMKENGINHERENVLLFETKTFNTDSSDSDGNNNDTINKPTRKLLKIASAYDSARLNDHASKEELCAGSQTKIHNSKQPNSLNSCNEKYVIPERTQNLRKKPRLSTTAKTNEPSDKEFNNNIKLLAGTTTKIMSFFSVTSNTRDVKKDNANAPPQSNDFSMLSQNKQIPKQSDSMNLQNNQQRDAKSTVAELLTFQTKSYYDSDSSECS